MPEVDEQAERQAGRLEVVLYLGAVLVRQFLHGLEFEDDLFLAHEVRLVPRSQRPALVVQGQRFLGHEGNALEFQLDRDALLVNRFQEPAALFPVHL